MKDFKHGNINLRTISRPSITISTKIEQEAQDSTKTYHSIKSKVQEGGKGTRQNNEVFAHAYAR